MSAPTCISCQVMFSSFEGQREHYKSDWHRYNLKRKVAELAPVSADNFRERVLAQRARAEEEERGAESRRRHCDFCNKRFSSRNAFDNHLASKKHAQAVKTRDSEANRRLVRRENRNNLLEEEEDEEDDESWGDVEEGEPLSAEECLFCPSVSASLEDNLEHMTTQHGLFVPDAEYCVDLEGLFEYLGAKVGARNACLWCDGKGRGFGSLDAVRRHMADKGHCRILHEGEALLQYAQFYDYSSSYPDGGDGDPDPDEEVEDNVLDGDGFELVLPSGATVGHRSLVRYYRQRLPPVRERPKNKYLLSGMLHRYRALGWTGTAGAAAVRNAKDLGYMRKLAAERSMKVGVKANRLQRHFRHQCPL